jgi:hypothetical protein
MTGNLENFYELNKALVGQQMNLRTGEAPLEAVPSNKPLFITLWITMDLGDL